MDNKKFFDSLRNTLYKGGLTQSAVDALDTIISVCIRKGATLEQAAYIMATAYHETGKDLKPRAENLNYTTAARIRAVWPSRFSSDAAAQPYVRNPQKLANLVYAGRLGNNSANDGWTYRGRGHVQTTGKTNYLKIANIIGVDILSNPDLLLEMKYSVQALVVGMMQGIYTGKGLKDYNLPNQYYEARAIVNADRSRKEGDSTVGRVIESYAKSFESALKAGGYGTVPVSKPMEDNSDTTTENWLISLLKILIKVFGSPNK